MKEQTVPAVLGFSDHWWLCNVHVLFLCILMLLLGFYLLKPKYNNTWNNCVELWMCAQRAIQRDFKLRGGGGRDRGGEKKTKHKSLIPREGPVSEIEMRVDDDRCCKSCLSFPFTVQVLHFLWAVGKRQFLNSSLGRCLRGAGNEQVRKMAIMIQINAQPWSCLGQVIRWKLLQKLSLEKPGWNN